jgi:uncharacterized protein YggE
MSDFRQVKTITLSVFITFIIAFIFFRFIGPIPLSVSQTTVEKAGTFDVEASGKVTTIPDTAEINLGIQVNKSTVQAAQKEANQIINKITQAVKKLGIDEKYIKTINYSLYPNYDYQAGQKIIGYNANLTLQVKVKDFDKINQVIDQATALGANQVGSLNFTIDEERQEQLKTEARKQAIEKAKEKAQQIAKDGGLRLGKIVNIKENVSAPEPMPLRANMAIGVGGVEEKQTRIQPGESEITVSIILSYETL